MHHISIFTETMTLLLTLCIQKSSQRVKDRVSLSLHYKPGKQNTIPDTLNPTPVSVEMAKTLLNSSGLTQGKEKPTAVCLNTANIKEHTNMLSDLTITRKCFTINDIKKGTEQSIGNPG